MKIIGVFDSGLGGLSVLRELVKQLHTSSFIYFADTQNCPYGPKGAEEIKRLSARITDFLLSKNVDIVVVACNTATASAIDYLRSTYPIPFVGMEPAVKPAALATKTKSIGVLATEGTFNGRLYRETTSRYAANTNVVYKVGVGLVEMVENGTLHSFEAEILLRSYIEPMLKENIDHLVLGCTHYPYYTPLLKKILPDNVTIVDPASAVAKQTARVLGNQGSIKKHHNECQGEPQVLSEAYSHFYTSGNLEILKRIVKETELNGNILFPNKQFFEKKL